MEILEGDKVQGLKWEREAFLSMKREKGNRWNGDGGLREDVSSYKSPLECCVNRFESKGL